MGGSNQANPLGSLEHTVEVLKRRESHLIYELGRERYFRVMNDFARIVTENELLPSQTELMLIFTADKLRYQSLIEGAQAYSEMMKKSKIPEKPWG